MRLAGFMLCVALVACGTASDSDAGETTGNETGTSTMSTTSVTTTVSTGATMSTSSTTVPGTSEGTTAVDTTDSSTGGTGDDSTTAADESTSSGSGSESSSSDSGSESGVTMHQACTDGCAIEFMCGAEWTSAQECIDWCEANLVKAEAFSPFCADAWENLSACFGTLDCAQFAEYQSPKMYPFPCSDQADALAFECKGQ